MPPDISSLSSYGSPSPAMVAAVPDPAGRPPSDGTAQAAAGAVDPYPSLVSLLDPSTGLVVLEFYNAKGDEVASLPTKKQLELYRLNEPSPSVFQPAIRNVDPQMAPGASEGLPTSA